jgi:hypothetical protein
MDAAGLRSRIEATLATDADHRRQAETELKAVCLALAGVGEREDPELLADKGE